MAQACSDQIIQALQANSQALIRTYFVEVMSYRGINKPYKLSISHVIDPRGDGSYKIKTSIGFGVRFVYHREEGLIVPETSRPAFSRGTAAVAAAA